MSKMVYFLRLFNSFGLVDVHNKNTNSSNILATVVAIAVVFTRRQLSLLRRRRDWYDPVCVSATLLCCAKTTKAVITESSLSGP